MECFPEVIEMVIYTYLPWNYYCNHKSNFALYAKMGGQLPSLNEIYSDKKEHIELFKYVKQWHTSYGRQLDDIFINGHINIAKEIPKKNIENYHMSLSIEQNQLPLVKYLYSQGFQLPDYQLSSLCGYNYSLELVKFYHECGNEFDSYYSSIACRHRHLDLILFLNEIGVPFTIISLRDADEKVVDILMEIDVLNVEAVVITKGPYRILTREEKIKIWTERNLNGYVYLDQHERNRFSQGLDYNSLYPRMQYNQEDSIGINKDYAYVNQVIFEIGNQTIDKSYYQWLSVYNELVNNKYVVCNDDIKIGNVVHNSDIIFSSCSKLKQTIGRGYRNAKKIKVNRKKRAVYEVKQKYNKYLKITKRYKQKRVQKN